MAFRFRGKVQFTLLGKIQVTYHNPSRRNTFGDEGAKTVKYVLQMNGEEVEVNGDKLQDAYAQAVRDGKVSRMDVYLD